MHSYFILTASDDPQYCSINKRPPALEGKKWKLSQGEPMGADYPPDVRMEMSKDHPGLVVPDVIGNDLHLFLVSGRLKTLLERESNARSEYLPASIINHKGRLATQDVFIINVLERVDCVDRPRSEVDESHIEPGTLGGLFRLQVDAGRIPSEAKLFRLGEMPSLILVRNDLRASMEAQGLTGARYVAMGEDCVFF